MWAWAPLPLARAYKEGAVFETLSVLPLRIAFHTKSPPPATTALKNMGIALLTSVILPLYIRRGLQSVAKPTRLPEKPS